MDPIAEFFTIPTSVRRYEGQGSYGETYAAATTELGRVRFGAKLVRNSDGEQVVSQAHVTYPLGTEHIPVGSLVTVPSADPDLERTVITEERHDTGMADMPNHYTIDLD